MRYLGIPGLPVFFWTASQAQRDHEIIHARNFRVQPQAIMGSGIVEYVVTSFSGRLADVGDVGGTVYPSKELMLLKGCVSVIRFSNTM